MKKHIVYNILIQLFILFFISRSSNNLSVIKQILSFVFIIIIFIPTIIEKILEKKLKNTIHYLITTLCLLFFIFLIAI